jgi:phosphoribosylformylglycinamidine (FGAM) synthase-like enzyme
VERTRPARLADQPLEFAPVTDIAGGLRTLLGSPNIASRRWIYQQYDQLVGSGTAIRPGGDAGVVRLTPSRRAIAVSLDGNGRRTSLDPRRGGMSAVCEAARNVACTGARPAAITNCLNFGNPETGEVGYELAEAIEGMSLACEALGLPVVSGNVSLYNEHFGNPIHPTPVVGAVGVLEDADLAVSAGFAEQDDVVLLASTRSASWVRSPAVSPNRIWPTSSCCTSFSPRRPSGGCCEAPTMSPTAAWRWRWPSRRSWVASASPPAATTHSARATAGS